MSHPDPLPEIDRARLERERRADPDRYGLEPGEGLHRLWAAVRSEPADVPWYRRLIASPALASAAMAAVVLLFVGAALTSAPGGGFSSVSDSLAGASDMPAPAEAERATAQPAVGAGVPGPGAATDAPTGAAGSRPVLGPDIACVRFSTPAEIAERDFAFVGTVRVITDEWVTFEIEEVLHGSVGSASGDTVTLHAPGMVPTAVTAPPDAVLFEVGERYLVSGSGDTVGTCGDSLTWSGQAEREWIAAVGAAGD